MRELVGVLVFVALLLIGFLATPGLFRVVDPDYLLTLRAYSEPLAKLRDDLLDTNKKITEASSKIDLLQKTMSQQVIEQTAKKTNLYRQVQRRKP